MIQVRDPAWKREPDIVADESFEDRYEEEDDSWADSIFARNDKGGFR